MATIAFPTASLASLDFALRWPGQTIHESIYTGARQVIHRGIGVWEGTLTWPALSRTDGDADIRAIESFLNQLAGAVNTFDIPIPVNQRNRFDAIAGGRISNPFTYLTISRYSRTGAQALARFNRVGGLLAGDYITIENKLFQLTSTLAAFQANMTPHRELTTESTTDPSTIRPALPVNWSQPFLRARRTSSEPISSNRDSDWAGPWEVQFTQATEE